jgi:predicted TIM-barrel fold metal-dependent hydrolase
VNATTFPVYDADHHIYEPEEAFTKYLPKHFEKDFYFVEAKGRKKLVIDGTLSEYIPNPTFAVVAAPGSHEKWFRADNPDGLSLRQMTGRPIRQPPEWISREGYLTLLDQQRLHACLVFPTLASVVEQHLTSKTETIAALFHSLNRWAAEEWGFAYKDRVYFVPFINLSHVDKAVEELEFVIKQGARAVGIRPAPVPDIRGGRSFGFPEYDPFWARVAEAGIFVCLHSSDSGYDQITNWWAGTPGAEYLPFERDPFKDVVDTMSRAIYDSVAALICHGVFARHPNVRIAVVENGATWAEPLVRRLSRSYGRMPQSFKEHPRTTFERHFYIAPFYEDDVGELRNVVPVERMLFGSDYPHPEGVAEPLQYLGEFTQFKAAEVEKVFSTNLQGLLAGKRD